MLDDTVFLFFSGNLNIRFRVGAAPVLADRRVSTFAYKERASILGNNLAYPYLLRTVPAFFTDALVIGDVVSKLFQWERVTVMYSMDSDGYGTKSFQLFSLYAQNSGITILSSHAVFSNIKSEVKTAVDDAAKFGAKVFVMFFNAADGVEVLREGKSVGLFRQGTQIIGGEFMSTQSGIAELNLSAEEEITLFRGFIGVRWELNVTGTAAMNALYDRWLKRASTNGIQSPLDGSEQCSEATDYYGDFYLHKVWPGDDKSAQPICAGVDHSSVSAVELMPLLPAYDAVYAFARGLHSYVEQHGANASIDMDILHNLFINSVNFEGVTGLVEFDKGFDLIEANRGGRTGDITYRVVNYQIRDGIGSFAPKMKYNHLSGFAASCEAIDSNSCLQFEFNTAGNHFPVDRPLPSVIRLSSSESNILISAAVLLLLLACFQCGCIIVFGERRIVKVTQPQLTLVMLAGVVCFSISSIVVSDYSVSEAKCSADLWLKHVGVACVFAVIAVKLWRISVLTGQMVRKTVTMTAALVRLGAIIAMSIVLLTILQANGLKTDTETIANNQFEYDVEEKCVVPYSFILYVFEGLLLVVSIYYAYITRRVEATLSNGRAITEGASIHSSEKSK